MTSIIPIQNNSIRPKRTSNFRRGVIGAMVAAAAGEASGCFWTGDFLLLISVNLLRTTCNLPALPPLAKADAWAARAAFLRSMNAFL
jgi:hypothetical protein